MFTILVSYQLEWARIQKVIKRTRSFNDVLIFINNFLISGKDVIISFDLKKHD